MLSIHKLADGKTIERLKGSGELEVKSSVSLVYSECVDIPLQSVLHLENPADFKLHLATWDGNHHPLDVMARDWEEWVGWSRFRTHRNEFGRPMIMALADVYFERHHWLFGGCFHVLSSTGLKGANSYELAIDPATEPFVGRLKIHLPRPGRGRAFKLEAVLDKMHVQAILAERFTGMPFPGLEWINLSFSELEQIVSREQPDWNVALVSMKGVYAIHDTSNGRKYVGAAYGGMGLWGRWACYVGTGHGWNDELVRLIEDCGLEYARTHFRLSVLEVHSHRVDDTFIIARESFWKEALLARGEHGLNRN